jgi:DNA-binding NtrC family response regulator
VRQVHADSMEADSGEIHYMRCNLPGSRASKDPVTTHTACSGASTALLFAPSRDDCFDLCSALQDLQVQVLVAGNSQDALMLAGDRHVSLILVDLDQDPEWKSTLRQLRLEAPRARLLAYSRRSEGRLWLDALDAGAFDFVCKPFQNHELRWILQSALQARFTQLQAAGGQL